MPADEVGARIIHLEWMGWVALSYINSGWMGWEAVSYIYFDG